MMNEEEIKEMQRQKNLNRQKKYENDKKARELLIWELELKRRLRDDKKSDK